MTFMYEHRDEVERVATGMQVMHLFLATLSARAFVGK